MDDGYKTSAPQWTDFSEITPNRHLEGDEYFDRIHENLEASSYKSDKPVKNYLRKRLSSKDFEISTMALDTSNDTSLKVTEVESTFMNDLDKIRMTPIKVVSPKTKNKESIVMQELSINEVLTNAIRGLEIASSKSRNCKKSLVLNATVCSSSTNNTKLTPAQRKIRISRSMYHSQLTQQSNNKTPAAKAAAIPRNINIPTIKVETDTNQPEKNPKESIIVNNNDRVLFGIDKNDENIAPLCDDTEKYKTPRRITRSMVANSSGKKSAVKNSNASSRILKTPKLKWPLKNTSENTDANETIVEKVKIDESVLMKRDMKCSSVKNSENSTKQKEIIKSFDDCSNVCQPDGNNENVDSIKNCEDFEKDMMHNDVAPGTVFEVHRAHLEHHSQYSGKATLLTNPARRRSSIMNRRRRSNKYISLAEAVSTFQRSTPTRFHTVSSKSAPIQLIKQQAVYKNTIPVSPALKSKTRLRRNVVQSQAEREELEMKSMQKHKIHANPIRLEILAAPKTLKAVPKKPITIPKPFKLSGKPKSIISSSTAVSAASSIPSSSSSSLSNQHRPQLITRPKRVMALVPSLDSQSLEHQEVLNFGIPAVESTIDARHELKKKTTRPQPFSLEQRHKQFLSKKEEKLKMLQNEEAKKLKYEFHARPVPAAVKKNTAVDAAKDKSQKSISHVQLAPFSFENRDKMMAKKKMEVKKKIEAEERKARIFHANPAPTFKPVFVRSVSRENSKIEIKTKSVENLRTNGKINNLVKINKMVGITRGKSVECLKTNTRLNARNQSVENLKNIRRVNSCDNVKSKSNDLKPLKNSTERINDQENIAPNILAQKQLNPKMMPALKPKLKPLLIELHSDRRARLRREYDEKVRIKLEQEEQRRKKEEENKIAREQVEIAEIRKKAEIKARPMPIYKPHVPAKSTKPLTEPESPAWSNKKH